MHIRSVTDGALAFSQAVDGLMPSLYRDQGLPPLVRVAVSPDKWQRFRSALSPAPLVVPKAASWCPSGIVAQTPLIPFRCAFRGKATSCLDFRANAR